MSGQSELSSIFRKLAGGTTTPTANSSWFMGTTKQSKVPSYITVLKSTGSTSSQVSARVQGKFGIDIKNEKGIKTKKHSESLLGSILGGAKDVTGNLVSDVISTAEGTPAGLLKIATTNPIDTAKVIGEDYAKRYGKLFHGDFGGFAHDVGQHPFGYLLDAASLGTGGGSILGRLAPALAKGGDVSLAVDRAAVKAGTAMGASRPLSTNVFTRNVLEKPAYALQHKLPERLPILGERAAAKRTVANTIEHLGAKEHNKLPAFDRAAKHAQKQSDSVQNAIDIVNHDLRVSGHASKYGASTNFSLKEGMARTPESEAIAHQIKNEIQLDATKQIVAKDGASAATLAFVKLHNAKEGLNQLWETRNGVSGHLKGIKPVDIHSDPVRNYMDTHTLASDKVSKAVAKEYVQLYSDKPEMVSELTKMYDKHGPTSSITNNLNKATQTWKDLILVGRPAFLVNNYVGNQVMYHLKNGVAGIALQRAAKGEYTSAFDKFFYEHRNTLGSTERAAGDSRYRRAANKVYGAQSSHEQLLRKATMREAAMAIPAIKTEVRVLTGKGMKEGSALESAMGKAFKSDHGESYRNLISKAIDDTMGNYRHFNSSEQALRKVVPFYSWNRHALRTYGSIIKDQPIEASALSEIGAQGKSENAKMFPGTPDFMKTYITGKLGTFDTQSLNPLKGGSDTLKSIKELVSANPGNMPAIASNLNPFISGSAQALSGVNLTTGAPVTAGGGLLGSVLGQTAEGLPQVKIGKLALGIADGGNRKDPHYFLTPTGQLKRKFKDSEGKVLFAADGLPVEAKDRHMLRPSLENSVLAWLGVPKRDVNLKTAQTVKKSIDSKVHPSADFHKRKTTKKTVKQIINLTPGG